VLAVVAEADPVPALFFGLGARGKTAEKVADEAVDQVVSYLQAASGVDSHSADQIVLPLAFASGSSQFAVAEVTRHLTTNVAVIRAFVEREIVCGGDEGKEGSVHIH
jgi:RNA 3'-terminal phosphate cyclase (ATP)